MKKLTVIVVFVFAFQIVGGPRSYGWELGGKAAPNRKILIRARVRINRYLRRQERENFFSGVVLVSQNDRIILKKAYGWADRQLRVRTELKHRFLIGSCSKAFTAMAIMILKDDGWFGDLKNERMVNFLEPEITCPAAWQNIMLYDLLTMASGLPQMTEFGDPNIYTKLHHTPKEMITDLATLPMHNAPGTVYEYNNMNYTILAHIVEKVAGHSFRRFLRRRIFKPFRMTESNVYDQSEIVKNKVSGYVLKKKPVRLVMADYVDFSYTFGTGELCMTISDFYKWVKILRKPFRITRASWKEMLTPRTDTLNASGFAYGWVKVKIDGRTAFVYAGAVNGFNSCVMYFPVQNIYILVLRNRSPVDINDDVLRSTATVISRVLFSL